MKILLGVDAHRRCQPVIALLGRLNFANAHATALSVVEEPTSIGLAVPPDMGAAISLDISRITEAAQKHAHKTAEEAAKALEEYGTKAEPKIVFGGAADKLEEAASEMNADLIAVGSEGKGTLEALIFGSVSSALCSHARTSVLVGKGEVAKEGKVRTVFATDHSKYATKCLHRFIEMSPQGISKITLMSAYQVTIKQRADMFGVPGVEPAIEERIQTARLRNRNDSERKRTQRRNRANDERDRRRPTRPRRERTLRRRTLPPRQRRTLPNLTWAISRPRRARIKRRKPERSNRPTDDRMDTSLRPSKFTHLTLST
jgi:nucleotide-binding universal stress UspA family protein